jgi:hypothetical protein
MSNLKRPPDEEERKQQHDLPSSQGDNSKSVTPKDVSSQDAAARDVTERKTCSEDPEEKEQEMLDDAVELTFPASDPIAIPSPERDKPRPPNRP